MGVERVVLELSEGDLAADQRTLYEAKHKHQADWEYLHSTAKQEPMLWVPDAVAWCFSRGGEWTGRVQPMIESTRLL